MPASGYFIQKFIWFMVLVIRNQSMMPVLSQTTMCQKQKGE